MTAPRRITHVGMTLIGILVVLIAARQSAV
jgi:hypothetical protein